MSGSFRIMTYNVHGCVGLDRRLDLDRIAGVIAREQVDAVALQELDVERPRSAVCDQPRALAARLGMQLQYFAARECDGGSYGNAVLSRYPLRSVGGLCLPRSCDRLEPRALQWVQVLTPAGALNLLNTHLGLDRHERTLHAQAMLGREWIAEATAAGATVLCGDLNARPNSAAYRLLTAPLRDAQLVAPPRPLGAATFPSWLPIMRIDHVLISAHLGVRACRVLRHWRARLASDHLPIVADIAWENLS